MLAQKKTAIETPPEWRIEKDPVGYAHAVTRMEDRVRAIREQQAGELVWLLEHPPLYTAGTGARPQDLLNPALPVHQSGRGGQYTYHGPGQRIAYVMLDLQRRGADLRRYIHDLESWIIAALAVLDVQGERREGRVGVWVATGEAEAKIAAIGVRVRKWVSYHGVSVNLDPDLAHYRGIVPCGIRTHGVTSLRALGSPATLSDLDCALRQSWAAIFDGQP